MKQKIFKTVKILSFAFLLVAEFFGFGLAARVEAACLYQIDFSSNKYTAAYADSFDLTATVVASGSSAECGNLIYFALFLKNTSAPIIYNFSGTILRPVQVNLQNNSATKTFSIRPQSLWTPAMLQTLPTPNRLDFQMVIYNSNKVKVVNSSFLNVNVINNPGSDLNVPVRVTFSPAQAVYNDGDEISVGANLDDLSSIRSAYPSINGIYIAVYVNNASQPIGGKGSVFSTSLLYPNLKINSQNGFKGSSTPTANTVTVKLFVPNTNNQIGQGSAVLQAKGIGEEKQPTPSPTPSAGGTDKTGEGGGEGGPGKPTDTSVKEVLFNPLPVDSLTGMVLYVAKGFLGIVGVWAVAFIIIGGFKLVMAQGNEEAYLAAKKTITWAILGVVVAMLSFSIIAIVQNLIGANVPKPPAEENPTLQNRQ